MEKIVKENTPQKKIDLLKTACLLSGIILVFVYYVGNEAIEVAMNQKIKSLNLSNDSLSDSFGKNFIDSNDVEKMRINADYKIYSFIIDFIARVIAVFLCVRFAKYVKGHWTIWAILAFIFPYLSLIIIGFMPLKDGVYDK
jgi:hypothetical protein